MYQKQWFLLCSMTSCKLPRHVHCKSNQHVSLRHALCKNRSKLVLQTAENRLQLAMKTISRLVPKKSLPSSSPTAPKFLQYSSKMPARCLQDASKPPARRPQIVCEATRGCSPFPSHAKDSSKRYLHTTKRLQAVCQQPLRRLATSPERFPVDIIEAKMLCCSVPMHTYANEL